MLEKPSMDSAVTTANVATVKRYAPPNQRNRSLGRRKSGGDRLERANSYSNDGEKNTVGTFRNIPMADHGDAGGNNRANENPRSKLIPLHGCSNSEAFRLLNDRWTASMTALNNLPEDSAEKIHSSQFSTLGINHIGNFPDSLLKSLCSLIWCAYRNLRKGLSCIQEIVHLPGAKPSFHIC